VSDPEHGEPDLPDRGAPRWDDGSDRGVDRHGSAPVRVVPGGGRASGPDGAGTAHAADEGTREGENGGDGDPKGSAGRVHAPADRTGRRAGRGSFLRELPVLVLIAFVLALLIKAVLVQAFWIPSESMERTLLIDDRVLVNKVVYHFRDVHRGEVVVFNGDGTGFEHHESVIAPPSNVFSRFIRGAQNFLGLGAPSDKDFIKRVIGVGGDSVSCCDAQGRVTVNDRPLNEPYVYQNDYQKFGPVKVPPGRLWVMGDHRGESSDSRQNGTIPQKAVAGRAFVRVWPLSRVGFLPVPGAFSGIHSALGSPATPLTAAVGAGVPVLALRRRRRSRGLLPALVPDRPTREGIRRAPAGHPAGRGRPPRTGPVARSRGTATRPSAAAALYRWLSRRAASRPPGGAGALAGGRGDASRPRTQASRPPPPAR
jgi:signal peptidase I